MRVSCQRQWYICICIRIQLNFPIEITEAYILIWYNGTDMLQQGSLRLTKNERVQSFANNNTLLIRDVRPEDSNMYKCRVLPIRQDVDINLKVRSAPQSLVILHGDDNVANQHVFINAKQGKPIHFQCLTKGAFPEPNFSWSHEVSTGHDFDSISTDMLIIDLPIFSGKTFGIEQSNRHHGDQRRCSVLCHR